MSRGRQGKGKVEDAKRGTGLKGRRGEDVKGRGGGQGEGEENRRRSCEREREELYIVYYW